MRLALRVCFVLGIAFGVGGAEAERRDTPKLAEQLAWMTVGAGELRAPLEGTPPRFAFTSSDAASSPTEFPGSGELASAIGDAVIATAKDGKATWVATDVQYGYPCGMEACTKITWPVAHATGLVDDTGHVVMWHAGMVVLGSEHRGKSTPIALVALKPGIDKGAEALGATFKTTMADPKLLAKAISDRKDVVMFGSEKAERYVGGATVRAQILKWGLGFGIRDGIQAGVMPSKTVAWVAANVDAATKTAKPVPYRVTAIYEKVAADWQIVMLQFSSPYAD